MLDLSLSMYDSLSKIMGGGVTPNRTCHELTEVDDGTICILF